MEPESFDFKSIPPTNIAVLMGLLYVILEGPYVGIAPSLPVAEILIIAVLLGLSLSTLERLGALDDAPSALKDWRVANTVPMAVLLVIPTLYWRYSLKFLGMSSEYLSKMGTDITCTTGLGCVLGAQQNLAFYPMDKMVLYFGGLILVLFILVQNEFNQISRLVGKAYRKVSFYGMALRSINAEAEEDPGEAEASLTGKPPEVKFREVSTSLRDRRLPPVLPGRA